jgi:hypothetical protein
LFTYARALASQSPRWTLSDLTVAPGNSSELTTDNTSVALELISSKQIGGRDFAGAGFEPF